MSKVSQILEGLNKDINESGYTQEEQDLVDAVKSLCKKHGLRSSILISDYFANLSGREDIVISIQCEYGGIHLHKDGTVTYSGLKVGSYSNEEPIFSIAKSEILRKLDTVERFDKDLKSDKNIKKLLSKIK